MKNYQRFILVEYKRSLRLCNFALASYVLEHPTHLFMKSKIGLILIPTF